MFGVSFGQGNGFSFTYTGPNQILVGQDCVAPLNWGHPNTPTVTSNIPGGMIVSFNIYSISGGYAIGDLVGGGTTVTVFYQAIDNFGNSALFGFTISFTDILPPVFDPTTLPANLTVNCTGNFPVADVEVHDNCEDQDIVLTLTFTETNNAMPCTGGSIIRTWVADDDLGNTSSFVQTITVRPDNTPPVIANNLQNGTAPCANAMALYSTWLTTQRANFTATDAGCGVMSKTDNAPSPNIIQSFCGPINVTFTATDNCANSSTVVKTFTVTNNVPPVITTPASNASGNCNQSNIQTIFNTWINTHGGAVATDDCSGVVWSTSPASPSINVPCSQPINVLFIAGDGCGNADTTSAMFTLTDNTPPAIVTEPSSMILSCTSTTLDSLLMNWLTKHGNSAAHDLCTSDNDLVKRFRIDTTILTFQGVLDAWQDSLNGVCHDNVIINGVGINNIKAYLEVEFLYTDRCDNTAGDVGVFGITDNGRPVFVTNPADTSFNCSQSNSWQDVFTGWYNTAGGATFMDQCSDVSVQANITSDSAMTFLTAALDTACDQGVSIAITFTLTDECGNLSLLTPTASFSLGDTIPPVISTPASDFDADCSADGQAQLNMWLDTLGGAEAMDGCGVLTWTFSWVDTSGVSQSGIPNTGPYPDVSTLGCTGGFEVIFTATDVCQNAVSDTAIFSIIDTVPPIFLITQDSIALGCTDTIPSTDPEVIDNCGGAITITTEDIESPGGCLGQPAEVIRIYTATDACGNTSIESIVYTRDDTMAPTFDLPSTMVEFCSVDTLNLMNVADNCDPNPVVSFSDNVTGPACQQTLERVWTVTDACGNSTTASQQFDLSDTSPPVITQSPGNFVFTCSGAEGSLQEVYEAWRDSVTITDGCSDSDYFIALTGSYSLGDTTSWPGTPIPDSIFLSCGEDVNIQADLVVFDICGNVVVEAVSFVVNDTTPPVINCVPVIFVEPDTSLCTGLVHIEEPTFTETCYPNDVTLTLTLNNGVPFSLDSTGVLDTIMDVGIHIALWTATDCKGNAGTCITSIEIIDENAVELTCPTDTLIFATTDVCSADLYVHPPFTTTGGCGKGVISLRYEIFGNATPDSMGFASASDSVLVTFFSGISEVLLIARDSTGDIDTCKYFVVLNDTISPQLTCQTDTLFLHPSGAESIDLSTTSLILSATDNCEVDSILYSPPFIDCDSSGLTIDVKIIVKDKFGNDATCLTKLVVITQSLIPTWERGLCDDTLRLFANIPPGPAVSYAFVWSGPNGFVSTDENPVIPDADTSFSGTYTVIVTSENGCVSTGSVEVLIQDLVAPIIALAEDTICVNEEINLITQTYSGQVTYIWNQITPSGDTVVIETSEPILHFIPADTGVYTFFAQVTQDTCTSEAGPNVTLYVAPIPVAEISDPLPSYCIADTLFLSPVVIDSSLTYTWTGPGGYISNEITPAGIPVIGIDSPYVFRLKVNDGRCSSDPDSVTITIQPKPETPVITGDTLACEGGTITLTASTQGSHYIWIDPQQNFVIQLTNTIVISPVTANDAGGWRVIVYDNDCPSDTSQAFIIAVDSAIIIDIIADTIVCAGDSITLQVSPQNPGIYQWSGPNGFTSDQVSPTILAEEGRYRVVVESSTGCNSQDSIDIAVDQLPEIISLNSDAPPCADGENDVRLWSVTVPDTDAFEYFWMGPNGFTSQDSSPVIENFNASFNGEYSLFITNGACTTDTATLTINIIDGPGEPTITGDNVYCFGDTIVLTIDSPIAGATYTWTSSDTTVSITSPGTLILPNATTGMTGVYDVVVNVGECTSASASFAVQVRAPLASPVITSSLLVCEGDSLLLTSNIPAGATIQWFGPNGFTSNEASPIIFPVQPSDAGSYIVIYQLNSCPSDTSASADIEVQETIATPQLIADLSAVCISDPDAVTICVQPNTSTAGAVYTYFLNGTTVIPGTDSCITIQGNPLQGGDNLITAIASLQGCPSEISSAVTIVGDEVPAQPADAGIDIAICPGDEIVVSALDPSPATGLWTSSSDIVVFDNEMSPVTTVGPLPTGIFYMTWTLSFASCIDYSVDSVEVEIISSPLVFADTVSVPFGFTEEFIVTLNDSLTGIPFTVEIVTPPQKGNILHVGNGIFRYSPNIGFVGTDILVYRICSTDCPEECSQATVVIRVGNEDDCFVPTLFTPNQDGINDVLLIPCLETTSFPDNSIIVFNEWGDAVFKAAPYFNNWDGRVSGSSLPVGTYFYIMDFGDGSTPRRSFLILER